MTLITADSPITKAPRDAAMIGGTSHHALVAAAIDHLVAHYQDQPSLDHLAAAVGMSPFHFQRVFKRWAGISPKRFVQFVTLGHAKRLLSEDASVLDTALDVGLSGPSRLHDLFVACEAMTPGEFKACGRDMVIRWGLHDGPVGRALVGLTDRGVCWFSFVVDGDDGAAVDAFTREWVGARLIEDPPATAPVAAQAFGLTQGGSAPLHLVLRGTNFQIKVWEALLRIPAGAVVSYEHVARAIGQPTATRAVGAAIGRNPISLIIPCHRVIQKSGVIHNYRWGVARKRALLAWEAARREAMAG
jgi:AraC family transcriptional regulator of adaptative response/methylated-DNA-[protein]-cysteine methyltransferase